MTHEESLAYIDYVWRLVHPNAGLAQPDDDGYEVIKPSEPVTALMEALKGVIKAEYDDEDRHDVLNRMFGKTLGSEQWAPFLDAKSTRTVEDLAADVAHSSHVPVVVPVNIAGMTRWEGGIFQVVVRLLKEDGADAARIRPSTRLSSYLLDHADVFQWNVARLAPAQMPPVHHRYHRWVEFAQVALKILTICLIAMCGPGFLYFTLTNKPIPLGVWFWLAALMIVCVVFWPLMSVFKPKVATAGEVTTFRDLCSALAVRYRDRTA